MDPRYRTVLARFAPERGLHQQLLRLRGGERPINAPQW